MKRLKKGLEKTIRGVLLLGVSLSVSAGDEVFLPRPEALEPDIQFWVRVYTEITSGSGFIHDDRHLNIVYTTVKLEPEIQPVRRKRVVNEVKQHYRQILLELARGEHENLTEEARKVLELWPKDISKRELREAADHLRFQLGQSDRFHEGLVRSGKWLPHIKKTLHEIGVLEELAALPHVESSFNPSAYSFVGAAGLWQFTRSTGRRYMRVDHVVDERMDPFIATEAAARLLKHNYETTGTWPLAITAYNHGAAGMRRATEVLGTTDIVKILRNYDGRAFGFASRNFYVAFLAAMDVSQKAEQYFGSVERLPEEGTALIDIPDYMPAKAVAEKLKIELEDMRLFNPALRSPIWDGIKHIPRGFQLRIPAHINAQQAQQQVISVPESQRFIAQRPDLDYRVQRGDTLSGIADRFKVSLRELVALNNVNSRHWIRAGQVLRLPLHSGTQTLTAMALTDAGEYRIQSGDTLIKIADYFKVDEQQLAIANGIENKHLLHPGQLIRIRNIDTVQEETLTVADVDAMLEQSVDTDLRLADAEVEVFAEMSSLAADKVESAEPATLEEADLLSPGQPASVHPALSADPSNYLVSDNNRIIIQATETLGHYADWLEIPTQRLRDLNRLKRNESVNIGEKLKLDFSRASKEAFEQRRLAYHRSLQEDYFATYKITGTMNHVLKAGEAVWLLSHRKYNTPIWLLRQYNPDMDFRKTQAGDKIIFPVIVLKETDESNTSSLP